MTKTDQLQELILSLSMNEKGYFKKYCKMYSSQKDQKYLKLYEVMEKEKAYNEKTIFKKLKGEVEEKKLPTLKNYLYRLILKVLEHFYSNKYPDLEISNAINQARVLYYKGLYEHAKKVLKKARKQAEQYELLYQIGEIMELEQKLFNTSAKAKTSYQENRQYFDLELLNLERLKNLIHCKDLERKIIDPYWLKGQNTGEKINLEHLLQELNITTEGDKTSVTAQLHCNNALVIHYYVNEGNLPEAFRYAEQNFNLIKEFPKISMQDDRKYIRILYAYLGFCMPLKKEDAFLKGLDLLESFKSKDFQKQVEVFDMKYNLYFNYVLLFGRLSDSQQYFSKYQKELPLYMEYLSTRSQIILHHLTAFIYHLNEDYSLALTTINQIFTLEEDNTRIDIQSVARIQDILLHFELENWELIKSKVRSCTRFLKLNKHLYPLNDLLLKAINSVAKNPNTGYLLVFKKLDEKISMLEMKDPAELKFLEHFDFISWVKSKVMQKPFSEVYIGNLEK